jgi:hypothetical protein
MDGDVNMDQTTRVSTQSLIPSPYTLHADWRSSNLPSAATQNQMLEITTASKPSHTICVQQHQCFAQSLDIASIMLTTSACCILQSNAGDKVQVTPITLYRVQIFSDPTIIDEPESPKGAISSTLASLLHIDMNALPELILCPKIYTKEHNNLHLHIVNIKDTNTDITSRDIQQSVSPAIWVHPKVMTYLGLASQEEVSLYLSEPADKSTIVNVLEHPGFCYMSQSMMAILSLQNGDIVELDTTKHRKVYAQLHSSLEKIPETPTLYLDTVLANILAIRKLSRIKLHKIHAQLYWISKLKVDEVQNKARRAVGLHQTVIDQSGYYRGEDVYLYHGGKSLLVSIEPITKTLPGGNMVVTPLTLRQAQLSSGQGVFLSSDHAPYMQANVGVLNVEEVEHMNAKGSEHLASAFPMPCWVELYNPDKGTSLDILLEHDPYPRKNPLIRLSRTTRQMLLVERGQPVFIKPVPKSVEPRSIRTIPINAAKTVIDRFLVLLIDRKSIYVSVAPAHTWDDHAQVARVDGEALTILGIDSGDRVRIKYRGKSISRVILATDPNYKDPVQTQGADDAPYNQVPASFQIGLDALARYKLAEGQMEFGCVVEIERNMAFILLKSLNLALLPIIGTVLTVLTFLAGRSLLLQIIVTLVLAGFLFYLALSVERSKVV